MIMIGFPGAAGDEIFQEHSQYIRNAQMIKKEFHRPMKGQSSVIYLPSNYFYMYTAAI
jgi:hypothetical protein